MPHLSPQNGNIYYETHGTGEPLIMIPGFASGAWNWFCQIDELSKHLQLITFDPRGIGRSKNADEDLQNLSLKTFVNDVLRIIDSLELEKVNVLGASFGGFVAQEFAINFPDRTDKLILACTSAGGANHVRPSNEILKSFAPDPLMTVGEKVRKFIRPAFTEEFNEKSAEQVEKVCRLREQNEVAEAVYLAQLQAAFAFDTGSRLGKIANETLVITGGKDIVVPVENSLNLAQKIPNAALEIVENGGHLFFVENVAAFNQAILRFLVNET